MGRTLLLKTMDDRDNKGADNVRINVTTVRMARNVKDVACQKLMRNEWIRLHCCVEGIGEGIEKSMSTMLIRGYFHYF